MFGGEAIIQAENPETAQPRESRGNRAMRRGRTGNVAAAVNVENYFVLRRVRGRNPFAPRAAIFNSFNFQVARFEPLIEFRRTEIAARAAGKFRFVAPPSFPPQKSFD